MLMIPDSKRYPSMSLSNKITITLMFACFAFVILADAPTDVREQIERLHSSDPEERAEAIGELARREEPAVWAIPFLIAMLGDDAAFPLRLPPSSYAGWFPSVPQTIGEWAAISFRGIGESAVEPLMAALKHADWRVRANAIWALGDMWGPGGEMPENTRQRLEQHLFVALKDGHPRVRKYAVKVLRIMAVRQKLDNPRAVEIILALLNDRHLDVRTEAAAALGAIGDPRAIEPLIAAIKDDGPEVRVQATIALGNIGGSRAMEELIAALDDDLWRVRAMAARSLGSFEDPRSFDALMKALKDEFPNVRARAAEALAEMNDPRAIEPLMAALKDKNSYVRWHVVDALKELAGPRAVEPLIATLSDEDHITRRRSIYALGELKDARAVKPLIDLLEDEDHVIRMDAREALRNITGMKLGEDPKKWREWMEKIYTDP